MTFAKLVKLARTIGDVVVVKNIEESASTAQNRGQAKAELKAARAEAQKLLAAAKADADRRTARALGLVFSCQKARTGAVPLYSGGPGAGLMLKGKPWAQFIADGSRVSRKLVALGQLREDIFTVEKALTA